MPHVLFRVNAGKKVGMGHLARCMSIARRIADFSAVSFMVSTDSRISVETFIRQHSAGFNIERLLFIGTLNMGEEIELLVRFLYENSAYLVLDHYDVNEEYQLCLKKQGVHWFQLDSHARQIFYADYVHHGSPGATKELYRNLQGETNTEFLLGTRYIIVDDNFSRSHKMAKVRVHVQHILVSFGGGDARGALRKYLPELLQRFPAIKFHVIVRSNNQDIVFFKEVVASGKNVELYIDCNNVAEIMLSCDLAILAPGGMSYEAATLGLPMILIAIEDNQCINLQGCSEVGIARSLGIIDQVAPRKLCDAVSDLVHDTKSLSSMSYRALKEFDGRGTDRIRDIFKQEIFKI